MQLGVKLTAVTIMIFETDRSFFMCTSVSSTNGHNIGNRHTTINWRIRLTGGKCHTVDDYETNTPVNEKLQLKRLRTENTLE